MRRWYKVGMVVFFFVVCAPYAGAIHFPIGFSFLGDSVTDTGNTLRGRFSPYGDLWPEWLALFFGNAADAAPSNAGGKNFSVVGHTVAQQRAFFEHTLLQGGTVDAARLYFVWLGSNDILGILQEASFHLDDLFAFADRTIGDALSNYFLLLQDLFGNGATMVAVVSVPNAGSTPMVMAYGSTVSSLINRLVKNMNARLGGLLNTTFREKNIMTLDAYTLLQEVSAHLSTFGFIDNTHVSCAQGAWANQCFPIYPGAFEDHVFADGIHPTAKMQRIFADYAISVLLAPAQVALLPQVEWATNSAALAHVTDRVHSLPQRVAGDVRYFIATQDVHQMLPQSLNAWQTRSYQRQLDATFGFDVQDAWRGNSGLLLSLARAQGELLHTGHYLDRDVMVTGYHQWLWSPWRVVGSIGIGLADFASVTRLFPLGIATRVEGGKTSGYHGFCNVDATYPLFENKTTQWGVVGSVAYQRAVVQGYTERGARATTMRFDRQQHDLAAVSMGLSYQGMGAISFGPTVTSWAELRFVNGSDHARHSLRASLVTWPHWFWLPEDRTQPVRFWQGRVGLSSAWTDHLSWMVGAQYVVHTTQPRVRGLGVAAALQYQFS